LQQSINNRLKNQTNITKDSKPGRGPLFIVGLIALAGAAVLALVFVFAPKSTTTAPDTSGAPDAASATTSTSPVTRPISSVPGSASDSNPDAQVLAGLVRQLNDASLPLSERQNAIYALLKNGSPEALAALKEAAGGSSPEIRGAIAGALRGCASPGCTAILVGLLHDSEESVAMAAVESLARQNSPEAATALGELLNDAQQSSTLRCEAALGLRGSEQFGVTAMLTQAAQQKDDDDVVEAALKALGDRDFTETQPFFQNYLKSSDVSSELRVDAVEAIGGASGDPTAFLASMLTDPDNAVRTAAAWALSATSATGSAGPQILSLLQSETDPDVRLRLYQALRNQDSFDVGSALSLVQNETDSSARIAGLDLLAKTLRDNPTPALQSFFDQTAIAELKDDGMNAEVYDDRQAAVLALTRAHTPAAMQALQELAASQMAAAAPPPPAAPQTQPVAQPPRPGQ
jgi:HEAT repeat protein